jgi:Fe-S-cluster containining protein
MYSASVARCRARVSALAGDALPSARDERDLVVLLERVWAVIGEELAARTDAAPGPACGAGCAICCSLNVATLAIEGAVAAARLRGAVGERAARDLAARLHAFHDRVRWLEDRQRFAERLACPFVDESGACAIHPARPLACRSVTSLDRDDCRAVADGEEDGALLVRMDLLHKALHDEALVALSEALQARGLDARCRDVSGMTAAFLADPGLVAAFLAGRPVPLE